MSASQQASHHRPVNEGYLTIKIQFAPGKSKNSVIVHCGRAYCKTSLNGCFFIFPPSLPRVFQRGIEFRQAPTGAIVYCSPTLSGPYYRTCPLPPGLEG